MGDQALAQPSKAIALQIVVEVAEKRHEWEQCDPCGLCPLGQDAIGRIPGSIAVPRDIETAEGWREQDSGKVR